MSLAAMSQRVLNALPVELRVLVTIAQLSAEPGEATGIDPTPLTNTLTQTVTGWLVTLVPERLEDGSLRRRGQGVIVKASDVAWPILAGQIITWNDERYFLRHVMPIPNLGSPVAFELELVV